MRLRTRSKPIRMQVGDSELLKSGTSPLRWHAPYTFAITMTWRAFFFSLGMAYLALNAVFACLYLAAPGSVTQARDGSFFDAFFFSVQTLSTVGYGAMAPASFWGHGIVTLELICGLVFAAVVTGLIFVRFARPKTNIIFAETAVIAHHNGRPTLMVRLANARENIIANANARLTLLKRVTSHEGRTYRHAYELPLVRPHLPLFLLTWTLMHEIDDNSPLNGVTSENAASLNILLVLVIDAHDHSVGTHIFDYHAYGSDKILSGMAYEDLIFYDADGKTHADLRKLGAVEPDIVRAPHEIRRQNQGIA